MTKAVFAAATLVLAGLVAGCGSSSPATPTSTSISGKVADGYLVNAVVFLDKNGNYRFDAGEPTTLTDQNGGYTLTVAPDDIGKYPVVALAVKGQTTDLDQPGQAVANSYALSLPAKGVSGTVSSFVSPISTLLREKMEANPGMSLPDAATELRNQMNLPAGMNMTADYVRLGSAGSGDADRPNYQLMHRTAQNLAAIMAGQAPQVMVTAGDSVTVDVNRFRTMLGSINGQLPQIVAAMPGGMRPDQALMDRIRADIGTRVIGTPPTVAGRPFRHMSSLFPPMTGVRFWNMTGHPIPVPGFRNMTGRLLPVPGYRNMTGHAVPGPGFLNPTGRPVPVPGRMGGMRGTTPRNPTVAR